MKVDSACVRALLRRERCVTSFCQRSFVYCYESMPAARCYSGSRDQVEIDQKRAGGVGQHHVRRFIADSAIISQYIFNEDLFWSILAK